MIFAKLDVCFYRHPRFLDAGVEASGYWAGVLAWLRENDSATGFIETRRLGQILNVGDKKAAQLCERLVQFGLFERQEGGYLLLRYADKNETLEEIEARRAATRERVRRHRGKGISHDGGNGNTQNEAAHASVTGNASNADGNSVTISDVTTVMKRGSTGSDSASVSVSERELEGESEPSPNAPSGVHRIRNATDDGAFGFAVSAWCEGVQSITGKPCAVAPGGAVQALVSAIVAHCPDPSKREAWARDRGAAYARVQVTAGRKIKPHDFGDWLNSDSPSGARGYVDPKQPAPIPPPRMRREDRERRDREEREAKAARAGGWVPEVPAELRSLLGDVVKPKDGTGG